MFRALKYWSAGVVISNSLTHYMLAHRLTGEILIAIPRPFKNERR
jgi:hypothetical protein